jgi:hypothetical protein
MKILQMPEFYPVTTVTDLAAFLDILAQDFAFDPATTIVKSIESNSYSYSTDNVNVALVNNDVLIVPSLYLEELKRHLEDEIDHSKGLIEQARATLRSYGVGMED